MKGNYTLIKKNASAEDTVKLVLITAKKESNSKAVKMLLKKAGPFTPSLSWFEKMFWIIDSEVSYTYDDPGREQVKTPDLLVLGEKTGDCDDYSTLWLAILQAVNVKGYPKIVDYEKDGYWDHIYVIVPLKQGGYITLDNVVGKFRGKFNKEVDSKDEKVFRTKF